jgi:hypothetical protein
VHIEHILVELSLELSHLVVRVGLRLVQQLSVPFTPLLLHHLLPSEILVFLLILLLPLVFLELSLLFPSLFPTVFLIIIIFVLVFVVIEHLHLVNECV